MSDDAYFGDDLVLDDSLLAALDAEEEKYQIFQTQDVRNHLPRRSPPPAKRQKTHHDWRATHTQRPKSFDELGDLPEISIQGDGSYSVAKAALRNNSANPRNRSPATVANQGPSRLVPATPPIADVGKSRPQLARQPSETARNPSKQVTPPLVSNTTPRPPSQLQRTSSRGSFSASPSLSQEPAVQRSELSEFRARIENPPRPLKRAQSGSFSALSGANVRVTPNGVSNSTTMSTSSQGPRPSQPRHLMSSQEKAEQALRIENNILRVQIEELLTKESQFQEQLKQAQNARLAKEGEVSILRNKMDNLRQTHDASVAELRASIEAAEQAHILLQKSKKEEVERLKSALVFKQHEADTSTRKPSRKLGATKPNKAMPPSSPTASQLGQWSPQFLSPTSAMVQTPCRPAKHMKFAQLPGFKNAFESTPIRPKGKGKEREVNPNEDSVLMPPPAALSTPPSSPTRPPRSPDMGGHDIYMAGTAPVPTLDFGGPNGTQGGQILPEDVNMDDGDQAQDGGETENPLPQDWKDELHRIILTHHPRSIPLKLTFQVAMNVSFSESPPSLASSYFSHSRSLLEAVGTAPTLIEFDDHVRIIVDALVNMMQLLSDSSNVAPLIALLNLTRNLANAIPLFTSSLLSSPNPVPPIITAMCDIVIRHLIPTNEFISAEERRDLSTEVLDLLETLCWSVPDDLVSSLSPFPRNHQVLMILLSPSQPLQSLKHASRTLAYIASHCSLWKDFLSTPNESPHTNAYPSVSPLIEQVAAHLVDTSKENNPEMVLFQENLLIFLTMLAASHPDSLTAITQSYTLIPSIIVFLSNISSPFWEEDLNLLDSPTRVSSLIELMTRTTALLHHMVISPPQKYNLSGKIQHMANNRQFMGLSHLFTVTMGRLGLADPPREVNDVGKLQLEQTSDMAQELLELVMDGPELDPIGFSFQPDPKGLKKSPVAVDLDVDEDEYVFDNYD